MYDYLVPASGYFINGTEGVYELIDNANRAPLCLFAACNVGRFDFNGTEFEGPPNTIYDCLAEQYTVKDNLGAIAVIAATREVHSNPYPPLDNGAYTILADYARFIFGRPNTTSGNPFCDLIGWNLLAANICPSPNVRDYDKYMLFGDPALNLFVEPTCDDISEYTIWNDRVDVMCNITVEYGVTLRVTAGTEVNFTEGASITVSNNAILDVNGLESSHVTFQGLNGAPWEKIHINSGGTADFEYADFEGNGSAVVSYLRGTFSMDHCTLEHMDDAIQLTQTDDANITDCSIQDCEGFGIYALTCDGLTIEDNVITGNGEGGIYLNDCTDGLLQSNINSSHDGGVDDNGSSSGYGGIHLDDSSPEVYYNWAEDNDPYQLGCIDGSAPVMWVDDAYGAVNTLWANDDDDHYPIYVLNSFPSMTEGHNNVINQESNSTILIYDASPNVPMLPRDVTYNWWGTDEPSERNQFYPSLITYTLDPWDDEFNELPGGGPAPCSVREDSAMALFHQGMAYEDEGDYSSAVGVYQELVESFHDLSMAFSALPRIRECAVTGGLSLSTIREYYLWLAEQSYGEELCRRAGLEAVAMKIHEEDYYGAIADYEDILLSSPPLLDSIQVAIDDAMAWLLAELNPGSGPTPNSIGRIPSLKTTSMQTYQAKVDELWALRNGETASRNPKLPLVYELHQNYPNPFNPDTRILYSLPEAAQVKIAVYNVLGQKVITLCNDYRAAGKHRVSWNGKSTGGIEVSSGIYFYRIEANNFVDMKKMVLLR
jgi:parallel beta-helix repeat protein